MLVYVPSALPGGVIPSAGDVASGEVLAFAHPSSALVFAQALAGGIGVDGAVALVLLELPDNVYGACCPSCFAALHVRHAEGCTEGAGPVDRMTAVVQPIERVRVGS